MLSLHNAEHWLGYVTVPMFSTPTPAMWLTVFLNDCTNFLPELCPIIRLSLVAESGYELSCDSLLSAHRLRLLAKIGTSVSSVDAHASSGLRAAAAIGLAIIAAEIAAAGAGAEVEELELAAIEEAATFFRRFRCAVNFVSGATLAVSADTSSVVTAANTRLERLRPRARSSTRRFMAEIW